jgi:N utilization substance protein B
MGKTSMTRNTAREIAAHLAYELSFTDLKIGEFLDRRLSDENFDDLAPESELYAVKPDDRQRQYIRRLVSGVAEHAAELDGYIEKYARGWKFERISLVASAIMRVAMYEILYMPDIPNGAAINEAVEIAKKYESPETVRFLNGILGSFVRQEIKE